MRHGSGRFQFSTGEVYEGEYKQDLRHGKGKSTMPDGSVYEGEFVDDYRSVY